MFPKRCKRSWLTRQSDLGVRPKGEWSRNRGKIMKLQYGVIGLAFAPLVFAGNDAAYPTEKIAAFVFEKVDVTTLPSAIRPKLVKNKKTFGGYGYLTREVDEKKVLLDPPQGAARISIEVLEAQKSVTFVGLNSHTSAKSGAQFPLVLLLTLTDGVLI